MSTNVFFKAGAQNVPRLAECLLDAHKFLTVTQVTLSKHKAALWAAHGHPRCLERERSDAAFITEPMIKGNTQPKELSETRLKPVPSNVWRVKKSELNVLGTSKLIHGNFLSSKIPENPPEYQKYYRQMNKVKQNLPLKLKAAVKRLIWTLSFCLSRVVSPLVHGTADGSWLTAPPRGWSPWCCYRSSAPPSASRWHQSDCTMPSAWWVCRNVASSTHNTSYVFSKGQRMTPRMHHVLIGNMYCVYLPLQCLMFSSFFILLFYLLSIYLPSHLDCKWGFLCNEISLAC